MTTDPHPTLARLLVALGTGWTATPDPRRETWDIQGPGVELRISDLVFTSADPDQLVGALAPTLTLVARFGPGKVEVWFRKDQDQITPSLVLDLRGTDRLPVGSRVRRVDGPAAPYPPLVRQQDGLWRREEKGAKATGIGTAQWEVLKVGGK